jgi:hypothetical protein
MSKHHVHRITDELGADAICARLGVSSHSIRYARTDGSFPASWYGPLKTMCDDAGIPCPLTAFNWRAPAKEVGDAPASPQGEREGNAA